MDKFTKTNAEKYIRTSSDAQVAQLGHLNYLVSSIQSGSLQTISSTTLQSIRGTIDPSTIATILNAGGGIGSNIFNVPVTSVIQGQYDLFSHAVIKITTGPASTGFNIFFGTASLFGDGLYFNFVNITGGSDEAKQGVYLIPNNTGHQINNFQINPFTPSPIAITFTTGLLPHVPLTSPLEYEVFYYRVTI